MTRIRESLICLVCVFVVHVFSQSCQNTRCPTGYECRLKTLPCIMPPCPKEPTCVAKKNEYPCRNHRCRRNEICRLVQVYCIRAPCPPLPMCFARNSVPTTRVCRVGRPVLAPRGQQQLSCTEDYQCPDSTKCVRGACCWKTRAALLNTDPCAHHRCPVGQVCEKRTNPCLIPPCPSSPVCVPQSNPVGDYPCASYRCRRNEICVLRQQYCFAAPCTPTATCVDRNSLRTSRICPIGQPVLDTNGQRRSCRYDHECFDRTTCIGGVCCWSSNSNTHPTQPRSKHGSCPSTQGMIGTCVEACINDFSCADNLKCCSNGCGHVCMQPVPNSNQLSKPGLCPSTSGQFGICVNECSRDSDCRGDKKCCSNGCGRVCVSPRNSFAQHPGTCPRDFQFPASYCTWFAPRCQQDSSCDFDEKCCYSQKCGRKGCMQPNF